MIPNSKIENVDYELIPSEDKSDGWNIRILNGQFSETVIEFGAVRFNEIDDNMSFSFEVISSPDPDVATENIDLQIQAGEILESVISSGLEEGSVIMKDRDANKH